MTMKIQIIALAATVSLLGTAAQAATGARQAETPGERGLQLAQSGEVDVVIDERGRRLVVDRVTGRVLGVMEREPEWRDRPVVREEPRQGGYRLDDPQDMERFRRDREILLGRREPPPGRTIEDYINNPDLDDGRDSAGRPPVARRDERRDISRRPLDAPDTAGVPSRDEAPADVTGRRPAAPQDSAALPAAPAGDDTLEEIIIDNTPSTGSVPEATAALPDNAPATPPAVVGPMAGGAREDVAKIQILLDRMHVSPGVIDGRMGDNVNKAISAYRLVAGQALRTYDANAIDQALEATGGPAFKDYEITPEDAAGPFVASVPDDYGQKAQLDRLSYTSVEEKLAERFHMDINYLKALNPGVNFNRAGTIIKVANTGTNVSGKVTRIEADKGQRQVRAYGADGRLLVVYPATIGSAATPSPTGTHTVERIALNPEYTYNPKINFKQGDNDKVLTIPPGPNGPVGTVWIALSKPTYGIHGTPEPSKIGKTESNGCIRLTNWDAEELAKLVSAGTTVEFLE